MNNITKRTTALALTALLSLAPVAPVFANTSQWPPVLRPLNHTTDFTDTIATAHTTIADAMEAHNITGLAIALIDASTGFTWTQGFGYADTATESLVDEHTLFQIASTSKPFTAISVMQLVEEGLIELDSPLIN